MSAFDYIGLEALQILCHNQISPQIPFGRPQPTTVSISI